MKAHAPLGTVEGESVGESLCGMHAVLLVDAGVTCSRCVKALSERARRTRSVGWDEAVRAIAHLLAGPPIEEYPPLTPDVWRTMRCLQGKECYCELCMVDATNKRVLETWRAEQAMRPHRRYDAPFGSVAAALELLLRHRQDGTGARSAHGSMQDRAEEATRLGTAVQTTVRHDRDPIEIRRVMYAADIESACRRAYAEEQQRKGLTVDQCVSILLSTVDTQSQVSIAQWADRTGLSEASVREMVSHGRRIVARSLWLDGYIPEPREPRSRHASLAMREGGA